MSTTVKNRVQLVGNLGNTPELKSFENNKLARFAVATSEYKKNKNGEFVTETHWHNVIAWGKLAEVAEKLFQKGSQVLVDGKLISKSFVDKEGNKRYVTEIQANELVLMNKKQA
ncbi:MAG: single-stranded DNA-binding protein [Sphingobacteriaceae bacterium]|jgi:single-strand DNA-binding protein